MDGIEISTDSYILGKSIVDTECIRLLCKRNNIAFARLHFLKELGKVGIVGECGNTIAVFIRKLLIYYKVFVICKKIVIRDSLYIACDIFKLRKECGIDILLELRVCAEGGFDGGKKIHRIKFVIHLSA